MRKTIQGTLAAFIFSLLFLMPGYALERKFSSENHRNFYNAITTDPFCLSFFNEASIRDGIMTRDKNGNVIGRVFHGFIYWGSNRVESELSLVNRNTKKKYKAYFRFLRTC